eukprot:1979922-Ditylum_brightwellii.AAC.1
MTESALTLFKNVYLTILLLFSVVIVMGLIFTEQTKMPMDVHPALVFFVFRVVDTLAWYG